MKHITIHTDGACIGNPGPGGYGAVLAYNGTRREFSGGFRLTTNNRMELMAAIVALSALKEPCAVKLYSDSQYVVKAMQEGWPQKWRAAGWRRNKKERAINPDLWEQLLALCETHEVEFAWVRGHSGDPGNERCDELANAAALEPDLPIDPGYKKAASANGPLL